MGAFVVYQPSGFCFRLTVPRDLRDVIGVREIRYSLQTHEQPGHHRGSDLRRTFPYVARSTFRELLRSPFAQLKVT